MIVYPPQRIHTANPSVFLAGTIDMGNSIDWQQRLGEEIVQKHPNITVYNPRRLDWDNSWTQSIDHPKFNEQVTWELDHLTSSDMAVFYFANKSQSPITLMEIGNRLETSKNTSQQNIVFCPTTFWRKGNVDILCARYNVQVFNDEILFENHLFECLKTY